MRGTRNSAFVLAFLLILPAFGFPQATNDGVLTNADVVKMVKAGLPENIIVREIQMSKADLTTTPAALIQLKKQGASERILGAMLDNQTGYAPEPDGMAQSAILRPHHMPSIEADLRLNSKKHEKVSVGGNQITVEQSGVPLFLLRWKDGSSGK